MNNQPRHFVRVGPYHTELCDADERHILASIAKLQARQKRVSPKSAEWHDLSETLAPLFAEMARRQGGAS